MSGWLWKQLCVSTEILKFSSQSEIHREEKAETPYVLLQHRAEQFNCKWEHICYLFTLPNKWFNYEKQNMIALIFDAWFDLRCRNCDIVRDQTYTNHTINLYSIQKNTMWIAHNLHLLCGVENVCKVENVQLLLF